MIPIAMLHELAISGPRQLVVIGGVHGAGKSTFCRSLAEHSGHSWLVPPAVADEDKHLSEAQTALREFRACVQQLLAEARSFYFEHVMSGQFTGRLISSAHENGYRIRVVYVDPLSVELAIRRVATRAAGGGHSVRSELLRQRLDESRRQFARIYACAADKWTLIENSRSECRIIGQGTADVPPSFPWTS